MKISEELKSKLERYIKAGYLDQFFDETALCIAMDSIIQPLVLVLKSRYTRLKMDRIKGVLSDAEEREEMQELRQDIFDLISLIDEESLKIEPATVRTLWAEIDQIQKEMETVTNERSDGIIKAGELLYKLGSILRGEPSSVDQDIPKDQLIKSAAWKSSRRLIIAFKEWKAVKKFQRQSFNSMMAAYRNLLNYLDYPQETINLQDKQSLDLGLFRLKNYISKLDKASDSDSFNFEETLSFFNLILSKKDELLPLLGEAIKDFQDMKTETEAMMEFVNAEDENAKVIASQLNSLAVELELSIGEMG